MGGRGAGEITVRMRLRHRLLGDVPGQAQWQRAADRHGLMTAVHHHASQAFGEETGDGRINRGRTLVDRLQHPSGTVNSEQPEVSRPGRGTHVSPQFRPVLPGDLLDQDTVIDQRPADLGAYLGPDPSPRGAAKAPSCNVLCP